MRRIVSVIVLLAGLLPCRAADNTIEIPLQMTAFQFAPMDGPIGSTPDPTDPNQFRASLTGNTLHIETQEGAVSSVVIQETQSERQGENYFYDRSFGSITCPITRAGEYIIRIGYWTTDFIGFLCVTDLVVTDFNGRFITNRIDPAGLPAGSYIIRLNTKSGVTTSKIFKLP